MQRKFQFVLWFEKFNAVTLAQCEDGHAFREETPHENNIRR